MQLPSRILNEIDAVAPMYRGTADTMFISTKSHANFDVEIAPVSMFHFHTTRSLVIKSISRPTKALTELVRWSH